MEVHERVKRYLQDGGHLSNLQIFAYRMWNSICSQNAEYIVEHRCTEWELERALIQYLKGTAVVANSLIAQLSEKDRGAIAAIVDQSVS